MGPQSGLKERGFDIKSVLQSLNLSCNFWRGGGQGYCGDDSGSKRGDRNPEEERKTERRSRKKLEKTFSNFNYSEG